MIESTCLSHTHTHSFSHQFSSIAQSCLTLCDPMNRSTPGLPVHHQLPEFTQTHIHRVSVIHTVKGFGIVNKVTLSYNAILLSHKKKRNLTICDNVDGYYAKCSNSLLLLLTLIVLHHSLSVSLLLCDFVCVCFSVSFS